MRAFIVQETQHSLQGVVSSSVSHLAPRTKLFSGKGVLCHRLKYGMLSYLHARKKKEGTAKGLEGEPGANATAILTLPGRKR
jgi:hypothetical protein